jgi:hypothetical protein
MTPQLKSASEIWACGGALTRVIFKKDEDLVEFGVNWHRFGGDLFQIGKRILKGNLSSGTS